MLKYHSFTMKESRKFNIVFTKVLKFESEWNPHVLVIVTCLKISWASSFPVHVVISFQSWKTATSHSVKMSMEFTCHRNLECWNCLVKTCRPLIGMMLLSQCWVIDKTLKQGHVLWTINNILKKGRYYLQYKLASVTGKQSWDHLFKQSI